MHLFVDERGRATIVWHIGHLSWLRAAFCRLVWEGEGGGRESPLLYYRTCMGDGKDEISWVEMRYALSGVEGTRNLVGVLEVVWGLMHR